MIELEISATLLVGLNSDADSIAQDFNKFLQEKKEAQVILRNVQIRPN